MENTLEMENNLNFTHKLLIAGLVVLVIAIILVNIYVNFF